MRRDDHVLQAVRWVLVGLMFHGAAAAAEVKIEPRFDVAEQDTVAWFPEPLDIHLSVRPPVALAAATTPDPLGSLSRETALIPLPPAAWTGLAGLVMLTVPTCRRMLHRFVR